MLQQHEIIKYELEQQKKKTQESALNLKYDSLKVKGCCDGKGEDDLKREREN